ncbi:MAG: hypothetical protein VKM34_11105 [Cyanobacteriota bacterium]|nr:hypothetical protein [Cyanobacteriota bacterium]
MIQHGRPDQVMTNRPVFSKELPATSDPHQTLAGMMGVAEPAPERFQPRQMRPRHHLANEPRPAVQLQRPARGFRAD